MLHPDNTDLDMRPHMRFRTSTSRVSAASEHGYRAVEPDTFSFRQNAYVKCLFVMVNNGIRPLGAREQRYRECCTRYRRYGVSTQPVDRGTLRQFVRLTQLSASTPRHRWNTRARNALRRAEPHEGTTPLG